MYNFAWIHTRQKQKSVKSKAVNENEFSNSLTNTVNEIVVEIHWTETGVKDNKNAHVLYMQVPQFPAFLLIDSLWQ